MSQKNGGEPPKWEVSIWVLLETTKSKKDPNNSAPNLFGSTDTGIFIVEGSSSMDQNETHSISPSHHVWRFGHTLTGSQFCCFLRCVCVCVYVEGRRTC